MPLTLSQRDRYLQLKSALWTDRSSFDAHWRELAEYFLPRRIRFQTADRNRGDKRNQKIIDSTARFAARTLASGLHAGLTSPARPWMKLTTPDPGLAAFGPVKAWLHDVTQRMLILFAETNLYQALPTLYGDMGVFGTAAMAVLPDTKDLFRCYAYPIGSYAFGLDARRLVTTCVREFRLTVRQLVETFGRVVPGSRDLDWSRISQRTHTLWEQGQYEESVDVCWIVLPNEDARPDRFEARYLPWRSVHLELGAEANTVLGDSGYRHFPILAPRWDVTDDDAYGTDCPGMTALGDNKQLQTEQRRKAQLLEKAVDPPLKGPPTLRTQKTSLLAGDITYIAAHEAAGLAPIHEVRLEGINHLIEDIREVQGRIQRAFYEDLFLMLARTDPMRGAQPVTAREIQERHEEKLLALGPVLERTNDELLDPLVDRVFGLMEAAELIPPAPPDLQGVSLKVEYLSILSQAQKLVGVVGQDRFLQSSLALVEVFPEVREKIDAFQVVDTYGDMLGVDPRLIRSTEEAQQRVEAAAEQQRAQLEAERAKTLADAARSAANAPLEDDSALRRLVGAA